MTHKNPSQSVESHLLVSLDFQDARASHLQLKDALEVLLTNNSLAYQEPLLYHYQCSVGQWLYGYALSVYNDIAEIHELEQIHAQIHFYERKIIDLYNLGKIEDARIGLSEIEKNITAFIRLLGIIEKKLPDYKIVETDFSTSESANDLIEEKIARLAAIVESSNDAIIGKKLDGIIISWNDSAQRIFGYTSDEMIGNPVSMLIPIERINEEREILARLKRGERVEHFETQRITKDKQLIDISLTISPIKDRLGNIIGASKVARDITKQKYIERVISENEERLNIVVDSSGLATWEVNLKTGEIIYSDKYLEMLGYKEGERPIYTDFINRLHPEDRVIREQAFRVAFKTGLLHYITRVIWEDNTNHWLEARGKVFYDEKEQPITLIGTARDLTAEKSYQHELEEKEAKFRLLASSIPQHIWTCDAQGNLIYFNQYVMDFSGLAFEEINSESWIGMIHPTEREESIKKWRYAVKTGEPFIIEHRYRRYDGEYRWQLCRAIAQKDSNGSVRMWVGTSTDIHDRKLFINELENEVAQRTHELKQSNDDLIKLNSELAQFAYVASHDLQEPLRKIQTFADRISELEQDRLSDKAKDYFNRMQSASKRMQQLIIDLLSYSRANTGEKHFELTDINSLLASVVEQLKESIQQKNAVINTTILPVLNIIPYQFEQLFTNLISNALKFSRVDITPIINIHSHVVEGKDIDDINVNTASNYYCITVADNGIGFDLEFSERIFQVFQRLHSKEEYPGTGIGLAIVKKIIENHYGILKVFSEVNKGATFYLYIPFSA